MPVSACTCGSSAFVLFSSSTTLHLGEIALIDEDFRIDHLDRNAFGIFVDQPGIDRRGAIHLSGLAVVSAEEPGAVRGIMQDIGGLHQSGFSLLLVPAVEVERGEHDPRANVLRVGLRGGLRLRNGAGSVALALQHRGKQQVSRHVLRVELDGLPDLGLRHPLASQDRSPG